MKGAILLRENDNNIDILKLFTITIQYYEKVNRKSLDNILQRTMCLVGYTDFDVKQWKEKQKERASPSPPPNKKT